MLLNIEYEYLQLVVSQDTMKKLVTTSPVGPAFPECAHRRSPVFRTPASHHQDVKAPVSTANQPIARPGLSTAAEAKKAWKSSSWIL